MYQCIISIQKLIEKYEQYALLNNETEIAHTLHTIKTEGAQNFRQALQLLRILHFSIWKAGNYHNTLGRFDQYMYPFYQRDLENGTLTKEEAFDLLEEFSLYAIRTATCIRVCNRVTMGRAWFWEDAIRRANTYSTTCPECACRQVTN